MNTTQSSMQDENQAPKTATSEQLVQDVTLGEGRVSLRFKPSEWAIIHQDIQDAGMNTNEYFRHLALEAPVPRRKWRKAGGDTAKISAQVLGHLGRIGNNLNQLTRHANQAKQLGDKSLMPDSEKILVALQQLQELLLEIRTALYAAMK